MILSLMIVTVVVVTVCWSCEYSATTNKESPSLAPSLPHVGEILLSTAVLSKTSPSINDNTNNINLIPMRTIITIMIVMIIIIIIIIIMMIKIPIVITIVRRARHFSECELALSSQTVSISKCRV